ncbi:MAG TPA: 2-phospho-L-lactate transferase CofD family protein [Candidatus Saccharimonadales bacterium]|nr:2-phospho-L-lactate transferase CofD family protein [Candidatus Saccharimonadales bacterium]
MQNNEYFSQPRIVVIGGGHGTAAIFPEITQITPNATAIISMSDSGGSTLRIREEFGILPPGDAANVITASSQNPVIREMNGSRLPGNGPLGGHTPKNVMLAAFMLEHGARAGMHRFATAMQAIGTFEPVTEQDHDLVMLDGANQVIKGEHNIDTHYIQSSQPWISHEPPVRVTPWAESAIREADLIVYAPGSPYTSQLAALCVGGVSEALRKSEASKVLVANLANEPHDTKGWHVADYVKVLQRHGIPLDAVLYNTATEVVSRAGKQPVDTAPERFSEIPTVQAIGAVVASFESKHVAHSSSIVGAYLLRHVFDRVYA